MFKKLPLLRGPLSAALRGGGRHTSSAIVTPSLLLSAPRFNHSAALSSDSSSTFYSTPSIIDFLGNIKFPGKRFCTGSAEKVAASCWSCHSPAETSPFLACSSCRCVQPVDCSVDYFRIYGLEKRFEIEDGNLEKKYKDWQKKLHPDLVHSKSEREREYAAEQSARVIDAYRTLSNPLLRAIYILRLEGVNVDEEETVSDPILLHEILEIREAVEEAGDSKTLHQIKFQIEEKLKQWSEFFSNAFQSKRFEDAQTSIQRMTYYDRINEEIVKKL